MKSRTIDLWEQTIENPPKEYEEYFRKEEEFLRQNVSMSSVVLDIGSGTGRTIKDVASYVKKFVGIDNDLTAINASKKYLKEIENVEIFLEDAENMHFSDGSFDVVFIGLTFCNFAESKMSVLEEIKRVLKDDGLFVFSVYNEKSLEIRKEAYDEYGGYTVIDEEKGIVKFDKDGGISEHFSREEISEILDEANFKVLDIVETELAYLIKAKKE